MKVTVHYLSCRGPRLDNLFVEMEVLVLKDANSLSAAVEQVRRDGFYSFILNKRAYVPPSAIIRITET